MVRVSLAMLLVQRNRFDAAAHVIVCDEVERKGDRQYDVWHWWDACFSGRADFDDLNRKIYVGFMNQFEHGAEDEQVAIAEIFGKGVRESKMNVNDFKKAIGDPGTSAILR